MLRQNKLGHEHWAGGWTKEAESFVVSPWQGGLEWAWLRERVGARECGLTGEASSMGTNELNSLPGGSRPNPTDEGTGVESGESPGCREHLRGTPLRRCQVEDRKLLVVM